MSNCHVTDRSGCGKYGLYLLFHKLDNFIGRSLIEIKFKIAIPGKETMTH